MAPLPGEGRGGAVTDEERAAHEAAMTEDQPLRAALDDLRGEGCAPASMSNRRKTGLGERLRRETGLPLREITAFLRISRSSYEYQRARLGRGRDAALRGPAREALEEGRGCYGYRRVHAALRPRRRARLGEAGQARDARGGARGRPPAAAPAQLLRRRARRAPGQRPPGSGPRLAGRRARPTRPTTTSPPGRPGRSP